MMHSLNKLWVLGLVFVAAIVAALVIHGTDSVSAQDPCYEEDNPRKCLTDNAHHIAMSGDIRAALAYATSTVARDSRNAVHIAMHYIGMEAYRLLGNVSAAMEFMPEDFLAEENYLTYEGYWHGLLMEFVRTAGAPPIELIRESCAEYWVPENDPNDPLWLTRRQCFHASGHGVMHGNGNDLAKAFAACAELPFAWMQKHCAFGAAMENQYLYGPGYQSDSPRPSVRGAHMGEVCEAIPLFEEECAMFVGRSYFAKQKGDFRGAYAACNAISDEQLAVICRQQISFIFVTDADGDFETMARRCEESGEGNYVECLGDVAFGIALGYGGGETRTRDFCASLPEPLDAQCAREKSAKECGPVRCLRDSPPR